jgi:hypothetical protein
MSDVIARPALAGAAAAFRPRSEVALCGLVAAGLSAAFVLALPRGGDLAAHLYRTALVERGSLVWDNLWFAGQYPLSSYSLLYYPLAALVGNAALGIAGVALAAALFCSVLQREWPMAARWPARSFAVLAAGQAFTGAYPYDLGVATLLATVWALQRRHTWLAAVCTVATICLSPLAFVFLGLLAVALFLPRRHVDRRSLTVAVGFVLAVAGQAAVLMLLPTPGLLYPYGWWRFVSGLVVAGLGAALALRGSGGWRLGSIFVVWAAASTVFFAVPSPVGHNIVRASVFVFPLVLLAGALADFRPRWLTAAAVTAALAAAVVPYAPMIADRASSRGSQLAFWRPVLSYLGAHRGQGYRVEAIPTSNHWETYFLPAAGIPIARGWYRQLDIADDPALYGRTLTPSAYRRWLRASGVQYVVLPRLPLGADGARREAALVRSGAAGLRRVWAGPQATIYALPLPTPILTGPAPASITTFQSSRIGGRLEAAGTYLLRVHYTPYWNVRPRSLCLTRSPTGMTELHARDAGTFTISAIEAPTEVLDALLDKNPPHCPTA